MLSALTSLAPHIRKADFDNEAKVFLVKYYPEALQTPMAVPILDIARKKMGLRVFERHLSEDFSILGQMCFTNGIAEIYDKKTEEYKEVRVRYGTIIIDPDTAIKRNEGCKNNTIAHECYHWHKHRDYHIAVSAQRNFKAVRRYYNKEESHDNIQPGWNDEQIMEWQASNIAPRILMPYDMFKRMVEQYVDEYDDIFDIGMRWHSIHDWVVNNLASFFKVSKKSVVIRLNETGFAFF